MAVPATRSATPRPADAPRRRLAELRALVSAQPEPRSPVGHDGAEDELAGVVVTGVTQDSRAVVGGDLYVARPGGSTHGAAYAQQAAAAGAAAVLTDPTGLERCRAAGLPTLVVSDPQGVLGAVSAWVYGYPARDLTVLGVTGTNGKTTTAFLLDAALRHLGRRTGQLGTVGTRIGDETLPSVRTTPEAPDLQAILAVMRERGVSHVSMEVSSHALTYGRVDGLVFDVAGFTNLSQDHLELHGDMEAYFAAKAALFGPDRSRRGVINLDDTHGARLAVLAREWGLDIVTYSATGAPAADWRAAEVSSSPDGLSHFVLHGPNGGPWPVTLGLPGTFNVANAVLATAMLAGAGLSPETFLPALATASLPGRMERVSEPGAAFAAIVDYAHTPDAIAIVLSSVRGWTKGRVIGVFGCGGDRDHAKRPLMGEAAARHADLAVVTDDNPRSEDPAAIRAAALRGAYGVPASLRGEVVEIGDRRQAIERAIGAARPGDTVLILGKGHEQGQDVGGVVQPFDDRLVVQEVLRQMSDTIGTARADARKKGAER
ncbi:UDP-N-acetylmuramoyl-L-alanyl-D-glutamate--2,6-diaminopimelate ligase [Actinopolymorpha sp. B9G3]|uniref:UDP-N-acetylmuramoyl-L-alanyl-D-glutamate--2, 6-diaminopimelate ligase n=1 Tax=Actinopolymorpha sp. B9G3 TaxID=3158970 RepID=UPI0032D93467